MTASQQLIRKFYEDINDQSLEKALSKLTEDVEWRNGFEGYFKGKQEVRNYWENQFQTIKPKLQPITIQNLGNQVIVVARQLVNDTRSTFISDSIVQHTFTITEELISKLEVTKSAESSKSATTPDDWLKKLR